MLIFSSTQNWNFIWFFPKYKMIEDLSGTINYDLWAFRSFSSWIHLNVKKSHFSHKIYQWKIVKKSWNIHSFLHRGSRSTLSSISSWTLSRIPARLFLIFLYSFSTSISTSVAFWTLTSEFSCLISFSRSWIFSAFAWPTAL